MCTVYFACALLITLVKVALQLHTRIKQLCSPTIGEELKLLNIVRKVHGVKILIFMMLLLFLKSRGHYLLTCDRHPFPLPLNAV